MPPFYDRPPAAAIRVRWSRGTRGSCQGTRPPGESGGARRRCPASRRKLRRRPALARWARAHGGVARRAGASPRPGGHASCGAAATMPCSSAAHPPRALLPAGATPRGPRRLPPGCQQGQRQGGRGACRRVGTCLAPGGPRRGRRQADSRLAAAGQVGRAPGGPRRGRLPGRPTAGWP